jgi:predicted membrane channel-forming protein YqfA (hemolysin III family)
MKTILYFFFALIGLICAVCSTIVLSTYPLDNIQFIGVLSLAIFGMALTMIFGYSFYWHTKENKLYDLAAKEQIETDYSYSDYGVD